MVPRHLRRVVTPGYFLTLRQLMLNRDFLGHFKRVTEANWAAQAVDPTIYGYQFRRGTRWNAGLADEAIAEYEGTLEVRFPNDFKTFLAAMNGTDLTTLNVYGSCGEPHREGVGVYAYPRDLGIVKERIEHIRPFRAEVASDLAEQGFDLSAEASLVPVFSHRYVVCAPNPNSSVVLSIVVGEVDAIVYGSSLREYLEKEFLRPSV